MGIGFPAWMCCDPLNTKQTAVTVAMVWMEMNGIQLEKPLSFTDVIRIGIAKAVKCRCFPCHWTLLGCTIKKRTNSQDKCLKAGRVVDGPWPGCSLSIWKEPTDKGCCGRVTFPCLPIGMNNEGHSPCLSFYSIFTPCQIHLGAFHHLCSPNARFSQ